MKILRMIATLAVALIMVATANAAAVVTDAAAAAAAVITSFNEAVSSRNLDKALGYLAPGSVQFTLRPSHAGLGSQPPSLTSDLRAHWSTIGPVLFSATRTYSRKAEIIGSRVEGDIATVWANVATATVRADKPETRNDKFVEVYLLVRKEGQWKIAAIADNRQPNDVGLAGASP